MIDFRYHLISIVAVLLALSIGVVLGSGLLGEPLLDDLERNVDKLEEENRERLDQITELRDEADRSSDLYAAAEPYILQGALRGRDVVIFEFEDVSGQAVDELRSAIGVAGGRTASTIEITNKMAIRDDVERDELGLAVGAFTTEQAVAVRLEAAAAIGGRASAAAAQTRAGQRFQNLMGDLEDGGFVNIDAEDEREIVPVGASFVIVGGSGDDPSYDTTRFATEMTTDLARADTSVMAAESSDSTWDLIPALLEDGTTQDIVATAYDFDLDRGRLAVILGLAAALEEGFIGHYGAGPGAADGLLPPPPSPAS